MNTSKPPAFAIVIQPVGFAVNKQRDGVASVLKLGVCITLVPLIEMDQRRVLRRRVIRSHLSGSSSTN